MATHCGPVVVVERKFEFRNLVNDFFDEDVQNLLDKGFHLEYTDCGTIAVLYISQSQNRAIRNSMWEVVIEKTDNYPYTPPRVFLKGWTCNPNINEDDGFVSPRYFRYWLPSFSLYTIFHHYMPRILIHCDSREMAKWKESTIGDRIAPKYRRIFPEIVLDNFNHCCTRFSHMMDRPALRKAVGLFKRQQAAREFKAKKLQERKEKNALAHGTAV